MTVVERVFAPAVILAVAPFANAVETLGERPDGAFPLVATPVVRAFSIARSAFLREEKTETRDEPGLTESEEALLLPATITITLIERHRG